jgi:hypothetical protein
MFEAQAGRRHRDAGGAIWFCSDHIDGNGGM